MNRWIWLAGLLLACCVHQHMCDASCTPGPAVQARLRRTPSAVGPSCLRVGRRHAAGSESCGMAQGTAEAEAEGQTPPPRSRFVGFSSAWVRSKTNTIHWNSNCTTKSNIPSVPNYKSFQQSWRVKVFQVWLNIYNKIIIFMIPVKYHYTLC